MPERSDNYKDLTPHHRKPKSKIRRLAEEWATENNITLTDSLFKAFEAGWNSYKNNSDLYTLEDIKQIMN
jgi:hypothetical protein